MLLRLYYIYKTSTKKTRELLAVVEELKEVFELPESGKFFPFAQKGLGGSIIREGHFKELWIGMVHTLVT